MVTRKEGGGFGRYSKRGVGGGKMYDQQNQCICSKCGSKIPQQKNNPRNTVHCQNCGTIIPISTNH